MANEWEVNALPSNARGAKHPETGESDDVNVTIKTVPEVVRKQQAAPKRAVVLQSVLASLSYGAASLAMVFLNKAVLMQYPYSVTLLFLQQAAAVVIIQVAALLGLLQMRAFSLLTARKLLPLSLFYNANVAFALTSLKGVNIPMYIAIKRLTPLGVLLAGCCIATKRPPLQVSLSVVLIAVGVIVAALGDFSFDPLGYAMALCSVFFQTAYLLLVERSGAEDGLSSTELMNYNAIISLPFMLIFLFVSDEYLRALPLLMDKIQSVYFFVVVVLSVSMGMILNLTMFWCTLVNSALTTTIVGVMKGVISMVLGFFVLGGVDFYVLNVTGLFLNTIGGFWYSFAKYRQKKLRTAAANAEAQPLIPTSRPASAL